MLKFIERCDCDILKTREIYNTVNDPLRFQFDSARKRMSTVLDLPDNESSEHGYAKRLHVKGASEIILGTCSHYLNADGVKTVLDDGMKEQINSQIIKYAKDALRTIGMAYKDLKQGDGGPNHEEGRSIG